MSPNPNSDYDLNNDNMLSDQELNTSERKLQLELQEEKADTQRRMAKVALATMIGFTILLFTPWVSVERIQALADLSAMFYITMGGIVAAFFGVTAWMMKNS